ncbi:MAG: dapF [Bacteroidota bacterium]|nr:dapF [Bacteroidota bacterium]
MLIDFFKYQGTGNDFVILDNRNELFSKNNSLIRFICDRRFGIGADGLMLLENAEGYDFRMVYYNSDGNESSMCGNGGRCIAEFARKLGVVKEKGKFVAIDGEHEFTMNGDDVKLKMIDVAEMSRDKDAYILFTGSPHYVIFTNSIDQIDIVPEARKIRYNDTYKEKGININYAEEKDGRIFMRTYERGVEGETLSCGTGTVAVAIAAALKNKIDSGAHDILTPGGNLRVSFEKEEGIFTNIWLEGPAKEVFKGMITVDQV